jgi:hypothetical protein
MEDIGIFNGHLVYFVAFWYIFPRFGMLHKGKSGNPGSTIREAQQSRTRVIPTYSSGHE